jgi:hypothetical protein
MASTADGRRSLRDLVGSVHREAKVALARPLRPSRWLFVVGCYNSGTTLLAELLSQHPEIGSLPKEGQYLTDQLVCDYEIGIPRMWCQHEASFRWHAGHSGPSIERIRKEWGARVNRRTDVILEKTPANIARMPWLQQHFRTAYFVAVVRNGYAVAEGIRRKAFVNGQPNYWPVELCARQWRRCAEVLDEDAGLLKHLTVLRYEDFVADPAEHLAAIWRFVGVNPEFRIRQDSAWRIHERQEAIRDLNAESIGRLSSADLDAIETEAGNMLARWRYSRPKSIE